MERESLSFNHLQRLPNVEAVIYPAPPDRLKTIIAETMSCLDLAACKANKIIKCIDGIDRINTEGFLYYYQSLLKNDIAPVAIYNTRTLDSDSGIYREITAYQNDIQSSIDFCGWRFGAPTYWIPSLNGIKPKHMDDIPILAFCNFLLRFLPASETEKVHISTPYYAKHRDYLIAAIAHGNFVSGDCYFAFERSSKQSENIISIDLNGCEVNTEQTKFEAWKEFKEANTDIISALKTFAVSKPPTLRSNFNGNRESFLSGISALYKVFIGLRMKGFAIYPDLTS